MKPPEVFVIAPFAAEWRTVLETVERAVLEVGYEAVVVKSERPSANFTSSILDRIRRADLIVADVSGQDPDVMYELGYAHALKKPTILLLNIKSDSHFPSNLIGFFYIGYDAANLDELAMRVKSEVRELTMPRSA